MKASNLRGIRVRGAARGVVARPAPVGSHRRAAPGSRGDPRRLVMSVLSPSRPAASDCAYVTLVTNTDFALGARALLRSLRLTGTTADLVVLHTEAVAESALQGLGDARLIRTELLPTSAAFNSAHARDALHDRAPFTKGGKPPYHTPLDNFAKLRLWQLDYERVVFLDADTLVLKSCDRLFDYPELSAAPNVYHRLADFHRMNSGVFTARPNPETFDAMLTALDVPGAFWPRTDQTFLQHHFPDWHGLPVTYNMLQYVWLNLPELWHWPSIHVLHYQYEKPWQEPHPKRASLDPWSICGAPMPRAGRCRTPPTCGARGEDRRHRGDRPRRLSGRALPRRPRPSDHDPRPARLARPGAYPLAAGRGGARSQRPGGPGSRGLLAYRRTISRRRGRGSGPLRRLKSGRHAGALAGGARGRRPCGLSVLSRRLRWLSQGQSADRGAAAAPDLALRQGETGGRDGAGRRRAQPSGHRGLRAPGPEPAAQMGRPHRALSAGGGGRAGDRRPRSTPRMSRERWRSGWSSRCAAWC